MLVAVIVLSVVIGFVVGAGAIGAASQRLGKQRRQPVWRQEVAAAYLESHLAYEVAAELSPAELRDLLRRHINQLQYNSQQADDASGTGEPSAAAEAESSAADSSPEPSAADSPAEAESSAVDSSPEPSAADSPAEAESSAVDSNSEPVTLTTDDAALADLYAQARAAGLEITKPAVAEVMKVHLEYLSAIGALVQSTQPPPAPPT